MDFGGATLTANAVYTLTFTLNSAFPTLQGGSGTNWSITINFQGSTTGGAVADTTNLSPAIAYNTNSTGYAAGTITTGTSPNFGYYRNVGGQTTFNFGSSDQRTVSQPYEGVGFSLQGNLVVTIVPEPSTNICLGALGVAFVVGFVWRRRSAA